MGTAKTPQQKKFKKAVTTCWSAMRAGKATVSPKGLGKCMSKELTKGKRRKSKKSRKKSRR